MGDPKRIRKKFQGPMHPWSAPRIEEERGLKQEYGLRNKGEIWRTTSLLKRFKQRAMRLVALSGAQAEKEQQQLIARMARLGLIKADATSDDILGLSVKNILDRRLQTILVKRHLARSVRQARQMITHRHVTVNGRIVTSPSYPVSAEEESTVFFAPRSPFANEQHPERLSEEELLAKKRKEEARRRKEEAKERGEGEAVLAYDEKDIEEVEVLVGEKKSGEEAVKEKEAGEEKSEEGKNGGVSAPPAAQQSPSRSGEEKPREERVSEQAEEKEGGKGKSGKKEGKPEGSAPDENPEERKKGGKKQEKKASRVKSGEKEKAEGREEESGRSQEEEQEEEKEGKGLDAPAEKKEEEGGGGKRAAPETTPESEKKK